MMVPLRRLAVISVVSVVFASALPGFGQLDSGAKRVVSVRAQFTAPNAQGPGHLFVTAGIEPGWHIYSITQPAGGPLATTLEVKPPQGVDVAGPFKAMDAPHVAKEPDIFGDVPIETHKGTVTWYAPLQLAAGLDPAKIRIRGMVKVQACDASSCTQEELPFVAALGSGLALPSQAARDSATVPAAAAAPFDMQGLLAQLGFAFLGGLILNLMPCVLPVISLKILAFLEQAGESRGRVFLLNVWYAAGMLAVFLVLAALAATAGLAWGEQFTLPWFKVAMTALVFTMALSFLGVWEIPIPGFVGVGRANELQAREGPSGAFFKGVFTTILATPCSGPFLGPVFGYLLKQPPQMAYAIFGAVGLGMASPYLVIGAFPGLIRLLPRPGAWMDTVKQLMGFFLLGTVVYLFSTLTANYVVPTLSFLVALWFACWWIGRTPLTAAEWKRNTAWIGGFLVAGLIGLLAFTVFLSTPRIAWKPFSPEALAQARAEGKTVLVDFSADWCPTCQMNLKFAVETPAVNDWIESNGVVPMLADWTDKSPAIKKALNELGRNSIPVLVVWPGNAKDRNPIVLSDLLSESQVLDALKQAGPSKKE